MNNIFNLFKAELKRSWALIKAYPVNELASIFILSAMFYMLFLGTKYMAGPGVTLGNRVDSIFVGYVTWLLMMTNYQQVSAAIRDESTQGTLMQLLTSPYSTRAILLTRAAASAISDVITISLVTAGIMLITGIHLHVSLAIVPFLLTALASAAGLGFVLGAVTLLYKKVDMLVSIVQYGILFGVMTPMEQWGMTGKLASVLVPTAPSASGLRILMVDNHFSWFMLAIALANVVVYLGGGLLLFGVAERKAKQRGLLGAF